MGQEDENNSKLGKLDQTKLDTLDKQGRAERNLNEYNFERPNQGMLEIKQQKNEKKSKRSTNDLRRLASAQSLSNFNTVNSKSAQNKHSVRNEHPKRQDPRQQPSSARPLAVGKAFMSKTQINDSESVQR